MLLKIAWRNVWRNKVRSAVVIVAIALGLVAGVFASAFVQGMMNQKVESVIRMEISHFQVHNPKFRDKMEAQYTIPSGMVLANELQQNDSVVGVSGRIITMGSVNSARETGMVKLNGIMPSDEAVVTHLDEKMVEGDYLPDTISGRIPPVIISQQLAEKYRVKLRSKLAFRMLSRDFDPVMTTFKVVGIFDTKNSMYDKGNVFVHRESLRNLLKLEPGELHEIAVLLTEHDYAEPMAAAQAAKHPDLEVLPWQDLALGMRYMMDMMGQYTYWIVGIILLALLFSIVNTMMMAVMERIREIGMLMAIGMTKGQVFSLIVMETVMLSMVGTPLGLLCALALVEGFGTVGIDLSGAAYEDVGFSSIVYPSLATAEYINVAIMVLVMALLAALYPAIKAFLLNPVEAIRKI